MTYAPRDLLDLRAYLLVTTRVTDDAIGIVGDPAHAATGGYHEGNDDLARVGRLLSDYSKKHSARDRPGTNAASGIDIGSWSGRRGNRQLTFLEFNAALVNACKTGDSRARDIREVIYTPDGKVVRRWDREGKSTTGDSSHLYHTHVSCYRDSEGRRAQPDNLLGLVRALLDGEEDMTPEEHTLLVNAAFRLDAMWAGSSTVRGGNYPGSPMWMVQAVQRLEVAAAAEAARDAAAKAAIDALAAALSKGGGDVSSAAIIARMDEIAAAESAAVTALRTDLAASRQEAADLNKRLAEALTKRGQ